MSLDGSPVKPIRSTPDLASSGGEDKLKAEVGGGRVHFDLTKNKRASIAGSSPSTVTTPSSTSSQSGSRRFSQASNYSALPHDARQRLEEMVRVRRLRVEIVENLTDSFAFRLAMVARAIYQEAKHNHRHSPEAATTIITTDPNTSTPSRRGRRPSRRPERRPCPGLPRSHPRQQQQRRQQRLLSQINLGESLCRP